MELSRVRRTKAEARATYDRLSRAYDWVAGGSERRFRVQGLERLNVRAGERVLEVGSGTGHALLALARAVGEEGLACGMDLSMGMCRVARARVGQTGANARGVLTCGDGATLPFPSGIFDAIFSCFTLELFDTPEIPRVLEECRRVLKPGGRVGVVGLSLVWVGVMTWLYERAHAWFPTVVDCRPIHVCQAMESAGFAIVDASTGSMWGLPVETVVGVRSKE